MLKPGTTILKSLLMAKAPKDSPTEVGQRIIWRNRNNKGVIKMINGDWAWVRWDQRGGGPEICHLYELKIDESTI